MILQKHKGRIYKDKVYPKWVIVVPNMDIGKLGWKEGIELESIVAKDMYILRSKQ